MTRCSKCKIPSPPLLRHLSRQQRRVPIRGHHLDPAISRSNLLLSCFLAKVLFRFHHLPICHHSIRICSILFVLFILFVLPYPYPIINSSSLISTQARSWSVQFVARFFLTLWRPLAAMRVIVANASLNGSLNLARVLNAGLMCR
jgi:hypothetical protein